MRTASIWPPAAIWFLLLLTPGVAFGQAAVGETPDQPAATEAIPEAAPPDVQTITPAAIAKQAEQAVTTVRGIREAVVPLASVQEIDAELDELVQSVDRLEDEAGEDLTTLALTQLSDLYQSWSRLKSRLDGWQSTLEKRSRELAEMSEQLTGLQEVWQAALDDTWASEDSPPEMISRVDAVLTGIVDTTVTVRERRQAVFALLSRVSGVAIDVNGVLDRINASMKAAQQRLFHLEAPPLWHAWPSDSQRERLGSEIRALLAHDGSAIRAWLDNDKERIVGHLAGYLALVALLIVLRVRGRRWEAEAEQDPSLAAALSILRRPFAAAAVAAVLPTFWIYPSAARPVMALIFAGITIPLMRLLPGLVYHAMRPAVYGLAAIFVINQIALLSIPYSLFQRLIMLLANLLAIAGLVWGLRPGGPAVSLRSGAWWRASLVLGRLATLLLGLSVVANLFGGVALAELISRTVLNSAFLAMLLFAAALVLTGLVSMLLRTRAGRSLRGVRLHGPLILKRMQWLIHTGLLAIWTWALLFMLRIWETVIDGIGSVLGAGFAVGKIELSLGSILTFAATLWVAVKISQFVRFVLSEEVLPRVDLQRGVAPTISMLVNYAILGIGFFVAVAAAGIEMGQFALLAGALGVGIGFGLQDLVNNFVSGLILIFERPIKVGDTVEVGQLIGEVRRIGIRSSTVRTFSGAEVIVPNGNLISSEVVNWTLSDQLRRIELDVGVAYGTAPELVQKVLVEAATEHSDTLENPAPIALFNGFGDSSLEFELRFWTANFDHWRRVSSDVRVAISAGLKQAGIEIPFPQRDLHVRSVAEGIGLGPPASRRPPEPDEAHGPRPAPGLEEGKG